MKRAGGRRPLRGRLAPTWQDPPSSAALVAVQRAAAVAGGSRMAERSNRWKWRLALSPGAVAVTAGRRRADILWAEQPGASAKSAGRIGRPSARSQVGGRRPLKVPQTPVLQCARSTMAPCRRPSSHGNIWRRRPQGWGSAKICAARHGVMNGRPRPMRAGSAAAQGACAGPADLRRLPRRP